MRTLQVGILDIPCVNPDSESADSCLCWETLGSEMPGNIWGSEVPPCKYSRLNCMLPNIVH